MHPSTPRDFYMPLLTCIDSCVVKSHFNMDSFTNSLHGPSGIVILKWPFAITRLTAHFTWALVSDLVTCNHRNECEVLDTK